MVSSKVNYWLKIFCIKNVRNISNLFHAANGHISASLWFKMSFHCTWDICQRTASWPAESLLSYACRSAAFTAWDLAQGLGVSTSPAGCAVSAKTTELPGSLHRPVLFFMMFSLYSEEGGKRLRCIEPQLFCKESSLASYALFNLHNKSMR